MKQQLYIHVGAGKTGTSALQEFFRLNQVKLQDLGIHIPDSINMISDKYLNHHELAGGTNEKPVSYKPLWKKISNTKCKTMLVSSEVFHSRAAKENREDFFGDIKSIMKNFEIKIIFYIRRQDQWIQSAYEEWIKSGHIRNGDSLNEVVKVQNKDLTKQLFFLADFFGKENIIVKPFERSQFIGGSIYQDFMSCLDIELDDSFVYPAGNSNPRLSIDALEFKRISNTVCNTKKEAQILLRSLKKYSAFVDATSQSIHRKGNLLSSDSRKSLLAGYSQSYEKIAKEFLGKEDGRLFIEEYNDDAVDFNYDIEDLTKISSFLMIDMFKKISKLEEQNKRIVLSIEKLEKKGKFF